MNRGYRSIFFFSFCVFARILPCYGDDIPSPVHEKNSLESIETKPFIPKVTLHSILHDFSLFDKFLSTHEVKISLCSGELHFHKNVKGTLVAFNLITDAEEFDDTLSTSSFEKVPSSHFVKKEVIENILLSKSFLLDVVSSLQRHKDYKEINAIFYPDNTISSAQLQKRLNNSLEFKVLAAANKHNLDGKLAKTISKNQTEVPLYEENLEKQNAQFVPYVHLCKVWLNSLDNAELVATSFIPCSNSAEKTSGEIEVPGLGYPRIIAENQIFYNYHPEMNFENISVMQDTLNKWEITKAKRYFSPLTTAFMTTLLSTESLEGKEEAINYNPEVASIGSSYLPIKTDLILAKSKPLDNETKIKGFRTNTPDPLITPEDRGIQRYVFIDSDFNLFYAKNIHPVAALKIKGTHSPKDYSPDNEALNSIEQIMLPVLLAETTRKYVFPIDQITNTEVAELISKAFYSQYNGNSLDENKFLADVNISFGENYYELNKKLKLSNNETIPDAETETINESYHEDYPSLETKDKPFHDVMNSAYQILNDKQIAFKEGLFGRLDSNPIKDSEILFTDDQLDYYSLFTQMGFEETILGESDNEIDEITLERESGSIAYNQITNTGASNKIVKISTHYFHPFSAPISEIHYLDSITKVPVLVSNIKEIIEFDPSFDYSKGEIIVDTTNFLMNTDLKSEIIPLQTDKIQLDKQMQLQRAFFSGDISLPKIASINDQNSFFLNPMLLLIGSGSYDFAHDISDTAQKTNQANRMTQYSLFNWPTLEELNTDSLPEAFALDTRLLTGKESSSTEFACTIKSYEKSVLNPLPIHMLYILDTSGSIEAHRFKIFKDAITRSIDYLEPDAKFNIAIVSKDKVEMLHENSVLSSTSSKGFAKRYLRKVEQSDNITFKDITKIIDREKTLATKDETHRMCVLLSDGNFASNIRVDRENLNALAENTAGNFSLYTASVSDKNNKPMLSFLAKINHGFSLYTRTHSSFSRKFSILVKHLQHPVMHDIVISFPDELDAKIYLEKQISPILLADKGFTFYGKSLSKDSSRVFIQGKAGDRWINILKTLPLNTARKGRYTFQKNLASQKSFLSLYSFLKTKDEQHIIHAKESAGSYDLSLPIP